MAKQITPQQLVALFQGIRGALTEGEREASREAAKIVQQRIKAEAPRGPTGNLKRSIQFGTFKQRLTKPVGSFVRVSRKIAPHAHLVEFGARGGKMPANAFFRRGFNASKRKAEAIILKGAGKAFDKAVK